jgi:superoxide dismutase, Cu-Zn family
MRSFLLMSVVCLAVTGCGRNESTTADTDAMTPTESAEKPSAADAVLAAATAQLQPTQGNGASGTLHLAASDEGIHVTGQVSGLEPNSTHGIHVHENGDCSAPDAKSAGEHFAPMQHPHGAPGSNAHVGDLGNIQADAQGVAQVDVRAPLASVGTGAATDVKGKAIIVHAKPDDLATQPSGDSGDRIACGVIA